MTVLTEKPHAGEFLITELKGMLSRKTVTVNQGQNLAPGTVIAFLLSAGAATAVGSPTGNGVITAGALGPDARPGVYKLVAVEADTNAGTFNFYAPDGSLIRQITVAGGAAANDHIVLTIADGATDFVAGDTFTITVSEGDAEILNPAHTDGTQIAGGVLYSAVDATDADKQGVAVYKTAAVLASALVWPSGISDTNKATAIAQLAARGIVLR